MYWFMAGMALGALMMGTAIYRWMIKNWACG